MRESWVWKQLDYRLTVVRSYEGAIATATLDYSEHAAISITELEVFTGNIYNKSGAQTRRQRDKSLRLKDEFDRIAKWAERVIRRRDIETEDSTEGQHDAADISNEALISSLACLEVGCAKIEGKFPSDSTRRAGGEFHSFKIVAACCAIKELDAAVIRAQTTTNASSEVVSWFRQLTQRISR